MKRVWIAISLLSVILTLSFLSLYATHTITKTMSNMFEEAYTQATDGNLDGARETADDIQVYWSKTHNILSTYMRHEEIEHVLVAANSLSTYLDQDDLETFTEECKASMVYLRHLWESEQPSFGNIL